MELQFPLPQGTRQGQALNIIAERMRSQSSDSIWKT